MSKIDIDKFVASILGKTESDFFSLDSDDIRNALADQGLDCKDGKIVELTHSVTKISGQDTILTSKKLKIEKGKWYVCYSNDSIYGGEKLRYTIGKAYYCYNDDMLANDYGLAASWAIHAEHYFRLANEDEIPHEPKFKVSDWIARGTVKVQIIGIEDDKYCFNGYKVRISTIDKHYHLWTIEDAKDGDVLVCPTNIFIYKETDEYDVVISYCDYHSQFGFNAKGDSMAYRAECIPASKEQRDLLFSKMKEAGYEWDAEKKELKKIENEPENYKQQVMSEMTDLVKDYIKQKPIWNEDDENMANDLIEGCISSEKAYHLIHTSKEIADWLKSIKCRMKGE